MIDHSLKENSKPVRSHLPSDPSTDPPTPTDPPVATRPSRGKRVLVGAALGRGPRGRRRRDVRGDQSDRAHARQHLGPDQSTAPKDNPRPAEPAPRAEQDESAAGPVRRHLIAYQVVPDQRLDTRALVVRQVPLAREGDQHTRREPVGHVHRVLIRCRRVPGRSDHHDRPGPGRRRRPGAVARARPARAHRSGRTRRAARAPGRPC